MILKFQKGAGDQSGKRRVEGDRHATAHSGEQLLHHGRIEVRHLSNRQQHEDKADNGPEQPQPQQHVADKVPEGVAVGDVVAEGFYQGGRFPVVIARGRLFLFQIDQQFSEPTLLNGVDRPIFLHGHLKRCEPTAFSGQQTSQP